LYLFKQGIKPEWEDKANVGGGCFKIKIDKKKSNKLWENTIFCIISPQNKLSYLINGVRMKIK
jgi:translation initiation factor 4E